MARPTCKAGQQRLLLDEGGARPGKLGKRSSLRGSGTPDQLRGNPMTPVIENTTLGHWPALPRPSVDALAAISRE
jgi:hypothetical protein